MFCEILIIIVICCLIATSGYYLYNAYVKYKDCTRHKMSFAESLKLCDLPIVCFESNGKTFNLMVDSGANNNLVDSNIIDGFKYRDTEYISSMQGVEGNVVSVPFIEMDIEYKGEKYTDIFQLVDMTNLFGGIKKEKGITIHGLLGNNFFQKYKYILNFDELTFYHV